MTGGVLKNIIKCDASTNMIIQRKCERLTCERDSLGRREDRVCLFLLWASRSTNMTDQEQPCRAETQSKTTIWSR